jgi:O-antigen/teichoic acid export membrane protein
VHRLGADRFGIFALAWALAGSVGLFDLGLGRALTKLMSSQIGLGRETATLFWTAMGLLLVAGLVAGAGLGLVAPMLANWVLAVASANRAEAVASFRVLALSVPFLMLFTGIQGALGAYQKFDALNAVRIPMGMAVFLAPVAILHFRPSLVAAIWVVVAVRTAGCAVLAMLCLGAIPHLRSVRANRSICRSLLSFGGWVMVSNVATPLLVYADRFIIGAMLSMAAVAWYATPLEIVARLGVIPAAVTAVLFPEMSGGLVRDPERARRLLARGIQSVFVIVFPATLLLVAFAGEVLRIWLGPEFASHSTVVLQSLAIGAMVLSVCWMPFYLLQAADRPDLTAKIHAIEVPLFLVTMVIVTHYWGLRGAATARGITFALDGLVMLIAARILMPQINAAFRNACLMLTMGIVATVAVTMVPGGIAIRAAVVLMGAVLCGLVGWHFTISDEERISLRGLLVSFSR